MDPGLSDRPHVEGRFDNFPGFGYKLQKATINVCVQV